MPLNVDSIVAQASNCLTADVADEAVVMAVEQAQYLGLDPIGKEIWKRIATPCRVEDLCLALAEEYEATPSVIQKDVLAFLEKLQENGAVTVRG